MLWPALSIGLTRGGGLPFPRSMFAGGTAGGWWDPSDLSTVFQNLNGTTAVTADGDPVGYIADKSGNGNHLIAAANDTTRPTYKTSGGLSWLDFDGVNDKLDVLFAISQPWDRIMAIRQISWTNGERLFSGVATNNGHLRQTPTTPSIRILSGVEGPTTADLAVGADGIVTETHNGASSRIGVNNGAYTTGSAGSASTDGLRVGANSGALSSWSNIRFYGGIMRGGTLADDQIADMRRYLAAKAGVSL